VPELVVFNKIDRLPPGDGARLARAYGATAVSAQTGTGLMELIERADAALFDASTAAPSPALREASGRG
jgi:50S ribosomal subunit-associated GTPase HflX